MLVFYLFVTYKGLLPYKPANLGNWHMSANLDIGMQYAPSTGNIPGIPIDSGHISESAELQIVDPVVDDHVRLLQVDHQLSTKFYTPMAKKK